MNFVSGRGRAITLIALASAAFAVSSPIARFARPAHPLFVAFGRVALASIVLFALDMGGVLRHLRNLNTATRWRIFICGALLGTHFALFQAGLDATSIPSFLAIAGIALIPTIIGHTSVQAAARTLPPAIVSLVSPGETLGGLLVAAIFLHEIPKPQECVGAALILSGVLFAIFGPISSAQTATSATNTKD
jgi:drug/metabolite transporter (DMT)-like permease